MIGIINCDLDQDLRTNGAVLIQGIIPETEIINILDGEQVNVSRYVGLIITGSRTSYDEDHEWIALIIRAIAEAHKSKIPVLGVCFGCQLIAAALGGEVTKNAINEVGYYQMPNTQNELFDNMRGFLVYESHHDIVSRIPEGAEPLIETTCIQAFRIGSCYGIQFHPEIDAPVARIMAKRDGEDVNIPEDTRQARQLFYNFSKICKRFK